MIPKNKIALIGIGNTLRGDDAVGLEVLRAIKKRSLVLAVEYYECDGNITELMELFKKYPDCVCIIDAVVGVEESNNILINLNLATQTLPQRTLQSSSHLAGLSEAVELAKIFGEIPKHLLFWGVVAQDFTKGAGLSDSIKTKFDEIVETIIRQMFTLLEKENNHA